MAWRRRQKGEPKSRPCMTLFFYAGTYFNHEWIVKGNQIQLRMLRDWAQKNQVKERVQHETWGSYMNDIEIITTKEARRRIRLMLSNENNWNVEGWGDWWPEKKKAKVN